MSELDKDLVFAGVDTHKDTHTLCLLDHMGRAIGTFRFAAVFATIKLDTSLRRISTFR